MSTTTTRLVYIRRHSRQTKGSLCHCMCPWKWLKMWTFQNFVNMFNTSTWTWTCTLTYYSLVHVGRPPAIPHPPGILHLFVTLTFPSSPGYCFYALPLPLLTMIDTSSKATWPLQMVLKTRFALLCSILPNTNCIWAIFQNVFVHFSKLYLCICI